MTSKSKLVRRRQSPPNAVQIELTEGCSLNCRFCGVQGIREGRGGYKFMTHNTVEAIVSRLGADMRNNGWNPRIEFAMHGEPTMNPNTVALVRKFGELKPRELIVVSNGTGFVKDPTGYTAALVDAGVTSICLDEYDGCDFVAKFRDGYSGPTPVYVFTQGHKFRGTPKSPCVVIKSDVSGLTTPYDKLNTHCGGGGPPGETNSAIDKRCAKPFRELSIRWDGNVSFCCNDFRGVYKVANVREFDSLDELWHHERFEASRQMLYAGDRRFMPCMWCDAISPRVGLLPDKYGKDEVRPPSAATARIIGEALAGVPYTVPVLRSWETGDGEPCLPPEALQQLGVLKRQPIDALV